MKKIMIICLGCCMCLLLGVSLASTKYGRSSHHHVAHKPAVATHGSVVNVNVASLADLQSLKGLGVKKSQAILAYRKQHGPFDSLAALTHVKGIGEALIARIQSHNPGRLVVKKVNKMKKNHIELSANHAQDAIN